MKIMKNALRLILDTRRVVNAQWWHGHEAGTLELNTTRTGLPLRKLTAATMQFFVDVDKYTPQEKLCAAASFKYKIRALHRAGVRNIKIEFDRF